VNEFLEDVDPDETQDIPLRSGAMEEQVLLQPISRLMHRKVDSLAPEATVADAVAVMTAGGHGCVVVVEDGQVVGIFTERDVLTRIVARNLAPAEIRLADCMTPNPECLQPEDEMAYALHMMVVGNFRHVPVVDDGYAPVGIFSARDLQREVVGHFEKDILNLPPKPTRQGPTRRYAG